MHTFVYLYFFLTSVVITSAMRKGYKPLPDMIEKLREKPTEEDLGQISIKKQFFQDIFMEHQKDDKLQFGYVCENPVQWEQRFEEKDLPNNRHRGKVQWGNIDGNYGEHYWDINHR